MLDICLGIYLVKPKNHLSQILVYLRPTANSADADVRGRLECEVMLRFLLLAISVYHAGL